MRGIPLSVSMGYSTVQNSLSGIVECIKRSDGDMYRDKRKKKTSRD